VLQYNFTGVHIAPTLQVLADEAVVRQATNNDQFTIKATIAPLPITAFEQDLAQADNSLLLFVLVVLAFPIIAGSFGSFIVLERENKAKHLQTVAGVKPSAYWLSSFLWDVLNYQIPCWLTIALFFIFDLDSLTTSNRDVFSGILAAIFLYGPAAASFTYCLSFMFTSSTACVMVSIISGFLIGLGGPLAIFILTLIGANPSDPNPNLVDIGNIISWCLRFNPNFCLGRAIFFALYIDLFVSVNAKPDLSAWSSDILLNEVIFLAIQAVFYLVLAILLDIGSTNPAFMAFGKNIRNILCCKCDFGAAMSPNIQSNTPPDSDVVAEEERVLSGGANSDLIVLDQLTKVYDTGKKAVDGVSLGIPNGQCFGLLGINGAGKVSSL
jgi:ABC-type multidrug transport system fused ATPase/permease subunit